MPNTRKILRSFSALCLAVGLTGVGLAPLQPVPANAQSMLERLFGRPTAEHRRKIGHPVRVERRVIRKKVVRRANAPRKQQASRSSAKTRTASSGYTYRTLCVRKADGYFFPVSFSTTENHFDEDLKACQLRCEGTEVDLYVHRVLREEAEQMVSHATGEAYTALPAAFRYRRDGLDEAAAEACKPDRPADETIVADLGALPFESPIPLPVRRPPEEALLVTEVASDASASTTPMGPKFIRQVGPRFFPAQ